MVDIRNPTTCGLRAFLPSSNRSAMTQDTADYREIGQRLASIRAAFGDLSQREWALKHAFGVTQWNNWENGTRRIPIESAEKLCALYGLTLDFVYRGRRDGLASNALKVL